MTDEEIDFQNEMQNDARMDAQAELEEIALAAGFDSLEDYQEAEEIAASDRYDYLSAIGAL